MQDRTKDAWAQFPSPDKSLTSIEGDDDIDSEEEEDLPLIPWCDTPEREFGERWVDYHDRGPLDVVLSGPITGGWGPNRWFPNRRHAYAWCVKQYGADRVKQMRQSHGRWSFLIKNLRKET